MTYHKTVVGFERVLKLIFFDLLNKGYIDCSPITVKNAIKKSSWSKFDDSSIMDFIKKYYDNIRNTDKSLETKCKCILLRKPPKLVYQDEFINDIEFPRTKRDFKKKVETIKERKSSWANKYGIDDNLWIVDDSSLKITKADPYIPISSIVDVDEPLRDAYDQGVYIKNENVRESIPKVIFEHGKSLTSKLSKYELFAVRIYGNTSAI